MPSRFVRQAIETLSERHRISAETDVEKVQRSNCKLRSGNETSFVSLFADIVTQRRSITRLAIPYHHLFYFPSRDAENAVGYDLSIGYFQNNRNQRMRTMHKLLPKWCDSEWTWSINHKVESPEKHNRYTIRISNSQNREDRISANDKRSRELIRDYRVLARYPIGDYRHLLTLLHDYEARRHLEPYLVLHICYCLHDYRRMGTSYPGRVVPWQIPEPESLLRTIVIDIKKICDDIPNWRERLANPNFKLVIKKNTPRAVRGETPQQYLDRSNNRNMIDIRIHPNNIPLENSVLTLEDFTARVANIMSREADHIPTDSSLSTT